MVGQQLCILSIFLNVWSRLRMHTWTYKALFTADVVVLLAGYTLGLLGRQTISVRDVMRDLWHGTATFALCVLAPVLQTMTKSWSDDTIASVTFFMLVIHLTVYDYDAGVTEEGHFVWEWRRARQPPGGCVALNAVILAGTILASRLQSVWQVFSFMCFAMELFDLFPLLSARWRRSSPLLHAVVLTPLLAVLAVNLQHTTAGVFVLVTLLLCVVLLGPALLVSCQRYKRELHGPWDIVHVTSHGG